MGKFFKGEHIIYLWATSNDGSANVLGAWQFDTV